jgi:hypothetical protein
MSRERISAIRCTAPSWGWIAALSLLNVAVAVSLSLLSSRLWAGVSLIGVYRSPLIMLLGFILLGEMAFLCFFIEPPSFRLLVRDLRQTPENEDLKNQLVYSSAMTIRTLVLVASLVLPPIALWQMGVLGIVQMALTGIMPYTLHFRHRANALGLLRTQSDLDAGVPSAITPREIFEWIMGGMFWMCGIGYGIWAVVLGVAALVLLRLNRLRVMEYEED